MKLCIAAVYHTSASGGSFMIIKHAMSHRAIPLAQPLVFLMEGHLRQICLSSFPAVFKHSRLDLVSRTGI